MSFDLSLLPKPSPEVLELFALEEGLVEMDYQIQQTAARVKRRQRLLKAYRNRQSTATKLMQVNQPIYPIYKPEPGHPEYDYKFNIRLRCGFYERYLKQLAIVLAQGR